MLKRILRKKIRLNPYQVMFSDDLDVERGLVAVKYGESLAMAKIVVETEEQLTPFKYKKLVGTKYGVIFETTRNHHGILDFKGKEKVKFGDGYEIVENYFDVYGVVIVKNPMGKYFIVNDELKQEKDFIFDSYRIDQDDFLICSTGHLHCWAIPAYKLEELKNNK